MQKLQTGDKAVWNGETWVLEEDEDTRKAREAKELVKAIEERFPFLHAYIDTPLQTVWISREGREKFFMCKDAIPVYDLQSLLRTYRILTGEEERS